MKKTIFTAVAMTVSSLSQFTYACDKPVITVTVGRPVVQSVQAVFVVTETVSVQSSLTRLNNLQAPVSTYVDHCRNELADANNKVASSEKDLADSEKAIAGGVDQLIVLRDVIDLPGCSVCIGGKSFSKDDLAKVLTLKISDHESRETKRNLQVIELAEARKQQKLVAERVEKWEAKQKDLVGRVNAIRDQFKAREKESLDAKQAIAAKAAIEEANKLAESLESQMKTSTEVVPAAAPSPSDRVSEAAADFDRLFSAKDVSAKR